MSHAPQERHANLRGVIPHEVTATDGLDFPIRFEDEGEHRTAAPSNNDRAPFAFEFV